MMKPVRVWLVGLTCLALPWLVRPTFGAPQNAVDATAAAQGWLRTTATPLESPLSRKVSATFTFRNQAGDALYHVVSLTPAGYILVAADSEVEPILGFSASGRFELDARNPLCHFLEIDLAARLRRVQQDRQLQAAGLLPATAKWDRLKRPASGMASAMVAGGGGLSTIDDLRVAPFIQTRWDQGAVSDGTNLVACFNYYTPPYGAGSSSNYLSGCYSTSWAQIMRYFKYPTQSVGTGSYSIKVDGAPRTYRLRGGDGLGGPYAWNLMPLAPGRGITESERQAIGALTADIGAVSGTEYGTNGSGGYIGTAIVNAFHYGNAILVSRLDGQFSSRVHPNLDAGIPVFIALSGNGDHSTVCDGYGTNQATLYHHLNLGWSGQKDAWYNLPNVDTEWYQFTSVTWYYFNIFTNGSGEIVSGRITDSGNHPIPNAVVKAVSGGQTWTAASNGRGIYALSRLPSNASFTLSVTRDGFTFTPRTVATLKSDASGGVGNKGDVNFTGSQVANKQLVSGAVTLLDGSGIPDVILAFSNGAGTATTDVSGYYLKAVLSGWAGTLTPGGSQLTFDPLVRTCANVTSNITSQDFIATRFFCVSAAASGSNDGTSWANAFTNLQTAIARAGAGSEIWVAQGTYYPGQDRTNLFLCPAGIPMYGGFAGAETARVQRDWEVHPTLLSGDLGIPGDTQDNAYHVVKGVNGALLDGFTITGGNANHPNAWDQRQGGGIYCDWGNTTNFVVQNCRLVGNTALESGGGGFAGSYFNCTVASNTARLGGGIGLGTATNCLFQGNLAASGGGSYSSTNRNCWFIFNNATNAGGGGFAGSYFNCTVVSNTAQLGGGIGIATATNCLFQGNLASSGGGSYSSTNRNCWFSLNNATNMGGGGMSSVFDGCLLYSNVATSVGAGYSHSYATNCLVFRNTTASYGAGAYASTNVNCTVTENTAGLGGGLYDGQALNCIVWNNAATYQSNNYCNTLFTYSCVTPLPPGTGNITNSPLFIDDANRNYRLAPESRCVNAGQNQPWMTNASDLDGWPRLNDSQVDMGAYEIEVTQPSLACSPTVLSFVSTAGDAPVPSLSFEVWNSGIGTLNYDLSVNVPWISLSAITGSSSDQTNSISVQIARAGLGEGLHTGVITLQATNSMVSQRTVTVSWRLLPDYNACLGTSGFVWNSEGNAFWQPQTAITHDGTSAAASGIIGDGQSSALWTSVNGPGQISFWWRVSSEVGGDPLKFFLNSQEMARISGETFWQTLSFNVPEGLHTVRWEFSKDGAGTSGLDTAWLDQVKFVGAPVIVQPQRPSDRLFRLSIQTLPDQDYYLEYKNSLIDGKWISLPAVGGVGAVQQLSDPNALVSQRCYRVRMQGKGAGSSPP